MPSPDVTPWPPDLERLAEELRKLQGTRPMQRVIETGRLIVDALYHGEPSWRKHPDPHRMSLRRMERHPGFPVSASSLSRAVAVYLLSLRRSDLLTLQCVRPSHLYELGGLPSHLQDELLEEVEREGWSVRRLREEVTKKCPSGRRRMRLPVGVPSERPATLVQGAFRACVEARNDRPPVSLAHLGMECLI